MTKSGEKSGAARADSPGLEASLDLAEELFVSCRFTEAARVCGNALSASSTSTAPHNDRRSSTSTSSSDRADSTLVVAFDDQVIAPVGECETSDLIVAVLLQCGFELRRTEEWRRCRAFYGDRGAMPFAVAILWLRLRLAGGEIELVRRVLWQLTAALGQDATTTANSNSQRVGDSTDSSARREIALANYLEATEMLVVQIMLPCGESTEASAIVSNDTHLRAKDKVRLLKECELSTIRTVGEDESGIATRGGAARNASSTGATGSGDSHSHRRGARRAATGGLESNGHTRFDRLEPPTDDSSSSTAQNGEQQQGSVLKFFADVADWTPEARIQLVVGAGAAGLAAYAALRNRDSLWRAARSAVGVAARTAGDIGGFIVGSS